MMDRSTLLRFWPKVKLNRATGCWVWTAATFRTGYGALGMGQRVLLAHRLSYETFRGPIPEGLVIDHLCRVRACVNPAHLEAVTMAENNRRGMGFAGKNARKTSCPQGHPYTPENTLNKTNAGWPSRECRTCDLDRKRRAHAASRMS